MRSRGVLSVLGTVALLAGFHGVLPTAADAATVAAGTYRIVNAHDDGCLTTTPEPYHDVDVGDCDLGWTIAASPRGATIAVRDTTACLAPAPRQVFPPRVRTGRCDDAASHEWTFANAGRGALRIRAVDRNSRCLSASGGAHGPVILLPCAVNSEETWTLVRVAAAAPTRRSVPVPRPLPAGVTSTDR